MNKTEFQERIINEVKEETRIALQLPTGFGKSKVAIDLVKYHINYNNSKNILFVVAKSVHKKNWLDEFKKWGLSIDKAKITIECYASLKNYKDTEFDIVVFDEAHHLGSDLRLDIISTIRAKYIYLLSATLKDSLLQQLNTIFGVFKCETISLGEAIDMEVLPSPKIYLIPLNFDNEVTEAIYKNVKKDTKHIFNSNWIDRWSYIKNKLPVCIYCTKAQYLLDLDGLILYYKKLYKRTGKEIFKNKWLRLCNDRLKWLSDKKTSYVKTLLDKLKNYRTLTFCNSIEQSELLGKNCIHSKNKASQEIVNKFNDKKIKHITSCQMLNEGVNLVDCRIGIYANINSSDIINKQKFGRLLRHKSPIIIIPYYRGTREQEVLENILKEYDDSLIKTIKSMNEIEL